MKIALIGYGRMGHAVEEEAVSRGHRVVCTVDNDAEWESKEPLLRDADVAVEFTTPATAVGNIRRCFALGLPVVCGTTGWDDERDEVVRQCLEEDRSLFTASNFSIGMNIMFELNRRLAQLMDSHDEYSVSIAETHHIHKLDAPSGTAITLAKDIIEELDRKDDWRLMKKGTRIGKGIIPITAVREGEVAGIHEVVYDSDIDTITLRHAAKSRKGLALGAVLAAEYLEDKHGYFTMKDLLESKE